MGRPNAGAIISDDAVLLDETVDVTNLNDRPASRRVESSVSPGLVPEQEADRSHPRGASTADALWRS